MISCLLHIYLYFFNKHAEVFGQKAIINIILSKLPEKKCFLDSSGGKVSACSAGDLDSIPGLGRFPGEGKAAHSSILAWKIPWMEEPHRL